MDPDTEALRDEAVRAFIEAKAMQERCAELQADDAARRARIRRRAAERYAAEVSAHRRANLS
jgi:hypothetical protein